MWETVYSVGSTTASTINIRLRARIKGLRKNWPLAIIFIIIILTITSLAETLKRCDQVCACYWDRPHLPASSTLSTLLAVASLSLSLFWSKHHRHKKWAILAMLIRQIHNQCIQSQSVSGNHPVVFLPDSLFYFTPRQSAFLVANDDVGQQVRLKLANSPQFLCSAPSLLNILGNGGRPLAKP